jgi:hypothetical protein
MAYSNISATMPQADIDAVKAALSTINQKMPFLINLNVEERKGLMKLGPKSVDFVNDALLAAKNYPTILPSSFNVPEFQKDNDLFKVLSEIKLLADSVCERINDTLTAVGSEAMGEALDVYAYVQRASDANNPGLKSVADKLRERFKGQTGRRKIS